MTPMEKAALALVADVREALGATPCLTLPSPQQMHGETLVMLHKRYPARAALLALAKGK